VHTKILMGNIKRGHTLVDLLVNGTMITKQNSQKSCQLLLSGFCVHGDRTSGSVEANTNSMRVCSTEFENYH
jgi:hypothetical protein